MQNVLLQQKLAAFSYDTIAMSRYHMVKPGNRVQL
jgi:hypothetical protein